MKTLLAIDNDAGMLKCLETVLSLAGYEVIVTDSPTEFLKVLEEREVDAVLVDIHMPEMSGIDLYCELRKQKDVPVLFVTAYPDLLTVEDKKILELWRKNFSDGMTDAIYKPFNADDLQEKVEALIGSAV